MTGITQAERLTMVMTAAIRPVVWGEARTQRAYNRDATPATTRPAVWHMLACPPGRFISTIAHGAEEGADSGDERIV